MTAALKVRAMTASEFAAYRSDFIRRHADDQVAAGSWTAAEAHSRAAGVIDRLLPDGVTTPAVALLSAEERSGTIVGHALVQWADSSRSAGGAWILDLVVGAEHRRKGYGGVLLRAAEQEARRHGASSIGLRVFAVNDAARRLYASAGYELASMQVRKQLQDGPGAAI